MKLDIYKNDAALVWSHTKKTFSLHLSEEPDYPEVGQVSQEIFLLIAAKSIFMDEELREDFLDLASELMTQTRTDH
tara:strand:+ start:196 stop:423 length:228 start_codon:yes stop_codon:yes gene_type:complete